MQIISSLVDMALDKKDKDGPVGVTTADNTSEKPLYPYNLCISLNDEQLEKLGLSGDVSVDDILQFMAEATVTAVSKNATTDGEKCRVELQITAMSCTEGHEEAPQKQTPAYKKAYQK